MSSKTKFLSINILIVLLMITLLIYNAIKTDVVFEINGNKEVYAEAKIAYTDEGVTATKYNLIFGESKLKVKTQDNINVDKIGEYKIKYILKNDGKELTKTRIVKVIDTIKPTIEIDSKEINSCNNEIKDKIKYSAIDNYDGNISNSIDEKIKDGFLVLTVKDSSNNETIKKIKITDISNEAPQISLNNNEKIYINKNEKYTEYGAIAYDSCDGDISSKIKITSNVNTEVVGEYKVTYKVEDSYGNVSKITRKVYVTDDTEPIAIEVPKGSKIYLTFDDGPGPYTEELLNVLDKYNVKATFFVTNQFPKYQHLIKEEVKRGHVVGVHSYSHLWNIYTSVDAYLADFNSINSIIYNQTGSYSKIFRFPGGSSNTISKKYNEGIMTMLSQKMLADGYQYYDWNVDSTDTAPRNTVESIIKNTNKTFNGNSYYIVLMHDIKKNTIKALPEIIEYAKSIGYEFAAIDETTPIIHSTIRN